MQMTRGEMNDHLARFCSESADYKAKLISNPKDIISRQFAIDMPANVTVKVLEDNADTVHVVLPHVVESGAELSDSDLEAVAGGMAMVKEAKCEKGILQTVNAIG